MTTRQRKGVKPATQVSFSGRYKELMDGTLTYDDLDVEELARGRLRNKNGNFAGRPPRALPTEMVKAMRREFFKRGDAMFEDNYIMAIKTMVSIMKYSDDDAVRFRAAQYVVERIAGKTPEHVSISVDAPWQVLLSKILVPPEELDNIVDADVLDEDTPL